MKDIFISYHRAEQARAAQLAGILERLGFEVWWDMELLAGEVWAESIEAHLRDARAVLVLWSQTSVTSAWVMDEASYAREEQKLIPVYLDDVTAPRGFERIHGVDLKGWRGEPNHPGLMHLERDLERILGKTGGRRENSRKPRWWWFGFRKKRRP